MFKLPQHHPFNPPPLLRLSIELDNQLLLGQRLFEFVCVESYVPQNENAFEELLEEHVISADKLITNEIKPALQSNSEQAIAEGVFGVSTVVRNGRLFWDFDAIVMAIAHHDNKNWPAQDIDLALEFAEGTSRNRRKNGQ